jgi:heptaprenyl diphosphate synthase
MTPSIIELTASSEDRRVAGLAAAAIGLTLAEAAIPLPIPGIKPGLANIVTLFVLYRYGWRTAAWVAGLRIVAGALALGQFLTPAFVLSLSGGICSLAVLAAAIHFPARWFGPVSLSLLAAFAHIGVQLLVVDVWLLPGASILGLLPLFLSAAWITGLANGLATAHLLKSNLSHPNPAEPTP